MVDTIEEQFIFNENSLDIMNTGCIYAFQFPDLKFYVGQTKRSLSQRFKEHISEDSKCPYLKYAFRKYGVFRANIVVLKRDIQLEHLDFYEDFFIKALNSLYPYGYNAKINGAVCNPEGFEQIRFTPPVEPVKENIDNPFDKFALPGTKKEQVICKKKEQVICKKKESNCKPWLESFPMLCR